MRHNETFVLVQEGENRGRSRAEAGLSKRERKKREETVARLFGVREG